MVRKLQHYTMRWNGLKNNITSLNCKYCIAAHKETIPRATNSCFNVLLKKSNIDKQTTNGWFIWDSSFKTCIFLDQEETELKSNMKSKAYEASTRQYGFIRNIMLFTINSNWAHFTRFTSVRNRAKWPKWVSLDRHYILDGPIASSSICITRTICLMV